MTTRPAFGLTFIPQFPPETLVDYARQAEDAGFNSLWLYEDCFYAGGFTSAATLLAATQSIRVGIGILPVAVRNPVFAAMEIATLARLYPGRFTAAFGHGFEPWMKQVGAYTKPSLGLVEETVRAVSDLLAGDEISLHGTHVHLEKVRLLHPPRVVPPVCVGGVREKTLQLAGRIGDGAILSVLSSPAYVDWAGRQIQAGEAEAGRTGVRRIVSVVCKVGPDGKAARDPVRRWLAGPLRAGTPHLFALGIEEEARLLFEEYGLEEGAARMTETWVDDLSASGTVEQAGRTIRRLVDAGADEVVLTPVEDDPERFRETIRYLAPVLER